MAAPRQLTSGHALIKNMDRAASAVLHRSSLSDVLSHMVAHTLPIQPKKLVSHLKELQSCIHSGRIDPKTWQETDSRRSLLHYAAAYNQVETIQFLIKECMVSPNTQDGEGNTPLHHAVMAGHLDATGVLLAHRADDTVSNTKQDPPLHMAIKQTSKQGNKLILEFTKHAHVSLFMRGYHDYSSLHITAERNNLEALELVYRAATEERGVEANAMKSYLLTLDKNGLTAFHIAARVDSPEVLEFLLSKCSFCGISPAELQAILSHDSRSSFHYAIERGHTKCAEVFLKYGADPASTSSFHPPPLHVACSHGELRVLKAMVETCGEEVLQVRDQEGGTALHSSTSSICSKGLISYLVVEKAVDIDEVDSNGFSPLSNSIQLGSLNAVDELLMLGADPLVKDKWGCNCLHRAVLGKRMEIFRKLTGCDAAKVMATTADNRGRYPIHNALGQGLSEMVVALLDVTAEEFKDADGSNYMHLAAASGDEKTLVHLLGMPCARHMINEANSSGCTPLHFAASGSSVAVVKTLMDYGAVIHKNNDGHTPFMKACFAGNLEAVELLYSSNKFQRDWVDLCGCSSLHLAVESRNPEVVTFCLDKGTAITFDEQQLTFFDKILDRCDRKMAAAVLSNSRWEECIDIFSSDKPHPILRILEKIPEVYGIILDHCYTHCDLDHTHSEFWEEFNFKCLSLTCELSTHQEVESSERDSIELIDLEEYDAVHTQLHTDSDVTVRSSVQRTQVRQSTFAQRRQERRQTLSRWYKKKGKREKERSLAVVRKLLKTRQDAYLLHPVVKEFIAMKWLGFGVLFQTALMIISLLLAFFFSVFLVEVGPPPQSFNDSILISPDNQSDIGGMESDYDSISTGSEVLLIITLALSILNLLIFFLHVYIHGLDLFSDFLSSLQVWLNFIASFCILLFLLSVLTKGLRESLWNSAALGIFFAWFSFGTTLQLLNVFRVGVYITMLLSTAKLIIKVLVLLVPFIFGFSFSFYILVGSVSNLQYNSIGLSMYTNLHSLVAVTDYLGFASVEQDNGFRFDVLTFLLLVVLVVLVPIVFINLLIGLAVGDIAAIQRDATISHLAVEVHALASLDKRLLPHRFTKHTSMRVHRHYPNKRTLAVSWLAKLFHRSLNKNIRRDAPEDKIRQYIQEELETERKQRGNQLHKLQEGIEQLAVDQLLQVEGMKRLEALVAKLVGAQ